MHPEELPSYIPNLLYTYVRERSKHEYRVQALKDAAPDVLRDACRQAVRLGTLRQVAQWLAAHPSVVHRTVLQQVLHEFGLTVKDDTPHPQWQHQLTALIGALPASVTQTEVITTLRDAWRLLRRPCILCNPTFTSDRINIPRMRAALQAGMVPYTLRTLKQVVCEACLVAYELPQKRLVYEQRYATEEHRLEVARKQEEWQRRLANYERGTGSPTDDFYTMRRLLTDDDRQRLATMPYPEFLHTRYWRTLRRYVLYQSRGRCYLCRSSSLLHVHHRTYAHRGHEDGALDDLVVLCSVCHAKHHDKLPSPPL